jgi:hypothetical protein
VTIATHRPNHIARRPRPPAETGQLTTGPSLDALKELKGLTQLTLDLRANSGVTSLDALKELNGLTQLTLSLWGTRVTEIAPIMGMAKRLN